jgi:hypothetical protein
MFCNKASFYGEDSSKPRPTPSWRTTHCLLSATAYSIYSQLLSILETVPLNIEELNDLYSSPNIVRVIKSRIRWAEHVARMGEEERCIQGFGGET